MRWELVVVTEVGPEVYEEPFPQGVPDLCQGASVDQWPAQDMV